MGPSEFCRSCGEKLKPCKTGDKNCKGCGQGYQCSGSCSSCNGSGWCKNGKQGIGGNWMAGQGGKGSGGMGKRGTGQGGQVGDLPDPNDSFVPSVAQGEVTKGKFLADMIQRTAPDTENVESKAEFISGVVSEAQQEAEQAITREEIPLGSREFVRQYFGSIDPKSSDGEAPAEAVETHSADDGHDHGAESGTQ